MRFWDKLINRSQDVYGNGERVRIAKEAERLESVVHNGSFDILIELIFDPMEKEAFEVFKKIDPNATMEIVQAQKMAQIIAEIKRRVESKILEGNLVRQQLIEESNSTPQEG